MYAASVKPLYGKTRGQVAYDAMELLRECVGEDKLLLACGAPMLPSFGVADYMRIGADMALSWPHSARRRQMHREDVSTPNAVLNSVYRRGLNGRAFLNDPDVFLLRRNNISFTPEQQALLAKFIQLFGGVLFTSDDVSTYKPEQASLFADTLADTAALTDVSQECDVLTVRNTHRPDHRLRRRRKVITVSYKKHGSPCKKGSRCFWNMICNILGVWTDFIRRRCDTVL